MSLAIPTSAIKVTDVSTTPQQQLGTLFLQPADDTGVGHKVWIYVQMTGSAAAVGNVLSRAGASSTGQVILAPADSAVSRVVGVAQHAIPQNSYGFILREGIGEVLADAGGVTVNLGIMTGDAAGTADASASVVGADFGIALETVASALATCQLSCRG